MTNYEKERESVIGELEPMVVTNIGMKQKDKKKLKHKIIAIVCLIVLLGIAAVPLVKAYNKVRMKDSYYVQKDMLKYLEKRYGEEFKVKSYHGPGYDYQPCAEMIAYPKKEGENYTFQVQGYYNKWNRMDYYDTYVMVKLTDEYEKYLSTIIGQYYNEYKLCLTFNSLFITNNLPVNTELEDLLKMYANGKGSLPNLAIFIPPEEPKENFKKLVPKLVEGNFRGSINVKHYIEKRDYITKDEREWAEGAHHGFSVYTALVYRNGHIEYCKEIEV